MSKGRRRHTAEQKAELLRQHVAEKKPVSEVCNEAEIQPSLFYTWQPKQYGLRVWNPC